MPPILGGKSLVTRRCLITGGNPDDRTARLETSGSGSAATAASRSRPTQAGRRPHGVGPHQRVADRPALLHTARRPRRGRSGIRSCRARPGRCGAGSGRRGRGCTSDRPVEQGRRRRPTGSSTSTRRLHDPASAGRRRAAAASAQPVDGAHLLAVVAAVDAVAEGDPELGGEHPRGLHQPGQAAAGVDQPRAHEGAGRDRRRGSVARPAPVGRARGSRGGEGASVTTEPSTNQEPAPATRTLAFFPYQPSPARYGRGPIDQGVVVHQHPGLPAVGPQPLGHRSSAERSGA